MSETSRRILFIRGLRQIMDRMDVVTVRQKGPRCRTTGENTAAGAPHCAKTLYIRCFGVFAVICNGEPVRFPTRKSEEILAYLVNCGRDAVMRDMIIEALWPDMYLVNGINNFHVNLHNMRKAFESASLSDLCIQSKGRYCLNSQYICCDAWQFEGIMEMLRACQFQNLSLLEQASELYRGQYFGMNDYGWSAERRYHYEYCFESVQLKLYDIYMDQGRFSKAVYAMRRLISADPLSPEPYEKCIRAYLKGNQPAAALNYLLMLEQIFNKELGEPLPETLAEIKHSLTSGRQISALFNQ